MTSNYIKTNGITLHYLDHPGREPVLVLLPGLTANAHVFDGLVAAGLSPHRRMLALDLRGRGDSEAPPVQAGSAAGYTMAEHAADLVGMLDELDIGHAVLGGYSFGGLPALYLAATVPERFERVLLLDTALSLLNPASLALVKPSLDRLGRLFPSWEAYLAQMRAAPFFNGWWDPQIETYYAHDFRENPDGSVESRSRPETIDAALAGTAHENWPALLAQVRQPVLLLYGGDAYGQAGAPPVVSAAQAQETAALLGACQVARVPGNHMTMLYGAGAQAIVAAINTFLDG